MFREKRVYPYMTAVFSCPKCEMHWAYIVQRVRFRVTKSTRHIAIPNRGALELLFDHNSALRLSWMTYLSAIVKLQQQSTFSVRPYLLWRCKYQSSAPPLRFSLMYRLFLQTLAFFRFFVSYLYALTLHREHCILDF